MLWRYFPPADGPGAFNMAADVAILEAIRAGDSVPVLRFYRWAPPCVTLGKFQQAAGNVRLAVCAQSGIDVARRPTGGRAILHDNEVTFSVIIPERDLPGTIAGVMDAYRVLGAAMAAGLRRLGLPAELVEHNATTRSGDASAMTTSGNPACFAAKARCDLMVNGKKIIGSAQLRKDGIILQQNSLPLSIDFPAWGQVFYRSDWEAVARESAVDLYTAAGKQVPYEKVVAALCQGFIEVLGVKLMADNFTSQEEARTRELMTEYEVREK